MSYSSRKGRESASTFHQTRLRHRSRPASSIVAYELEAKYADSQTNTDLRAPSDWLASPTGTYEEVSAFGRAA